MIEKRDGRITAEAEVVAVISTMSAQSPGEKWGVLTQGRYIDRLANSDESPVQSNVSVSLDALEAMLLDFGDAPQKHYSIRELLLQSHYDAQHIFYDAKAAETVFDPLLQGAEQALSAAPIEFRQLVEARLAGTTSAFADSPRFAVARLIVAHTKQVQEEGQRLRRDNDELRARLEAAERALNRESGALGASSEGARRKRKQQRGSTRRKR